MPCCISLISRSYTDYILPTIRNALYILFQQTISIMSYDGEQLVGHWIPVNRAKRVIIAVHGWRGSWTQTFGMVADSFEQNDCSVLYIEQRATNQSGGKYIGFGLVERHDCQSWINWVVERCGNEIPIYLCGVSMGATTVLM